MLLFLPACRAGPGPPLPGTPQHLGAQTANPHGRLLIRIQTPASIYGREGTWELCQKTTAQPNTKPGAGTWSCTGREAL